MKIPLIFIGWMEDEGLPYTQFSFIATIVAVFLIFLIKRGLKVSEHTPCYVNIKMDCKIIANYALN